MPKIRHYCPEDVGAIVALFRDTVRRINIRDYSVEQVRAWAPDEIDGQRWADRLANRCCVIAEIDGVIVGFADLESDGHLDHLFVHADHQRRGVGAALLAALHGEAARRGIARLFTEASITARPFFERHGYRVLQEQVVVVRGVELVNYRMDNHAIFEMGMEIE